MPTKTTPPSTIKFPADETQRKELAEFRAALEKLPPDASDLALWRWRIGPFYLAAIHGDLANHKVETIAQLLKERKKWDVPPAILQELLKKFGAEETARLARKADRAARATKNPPKPAAGEKPAQDAGKKAPSATDEK